MGKEQRAREHAQRIKRERRWVWLKMILAFLLWPLWVGVQLAQDCDKENKWPWQT